MTICRRAACSAFGALFTRGAFVDYKDAEAPFRRQLFDLRDGEIDFPACHGALKAVHFKDWPRVGPDNARSRVVDKLEPVHA